MGWSSMISPPLGDYEVSIANGWIKEPTSQKSCYRQAQLIYNGKHESNMSDCTRSRKLTESRPRYSRWRQMRWHQSSTLSCWAGFLSTSPIVNDNKCPMAILFLDLKSLRYYVVFQQCFHQTSTSGALRWWCKAHVLLQGQLLPTQATA